MKKLKTAIIKPYMWTYSGKNLYLRNPKPSDFDVTTIAVALGRICRFGAQSKVFYSVAQHSVLITELLQVLTLDKRLLRASLFHDGSEAFIGDCISPLKYDKYFNKAYRPLEELFMNCIAKKFKFDFTENVKKIIKTCEKKIEMAEIRDLMNLSKSERRKLDFSICYEIPNLLNRTLLPDDATKLSLDKYEQIKKD